MNCSTKDFVDAIITAAVRRGSDGHGKDALNGRMFTLARTDRESFGILLVAALRLKMKAGPEHGAAPKTTLTWEETRVELRERGLREEFLNYLPPAPEPSKDAQPNGTRELMEAIINAAIRHGSDGHGKDGLLGYMLVLERTKFKTFVRLMELALQWQVKAPPQSEEPQLTYEGAIAALLARGIDYEAIHKEIYGGPQPLDPGEDPDPWGLGYDAAFPPLTKGGERRRTDDLHSRPPREAWPPREADNRDYAAPDQGRAAMFPARSRLPAIPSCRMAMTISSRVKSGCSEQPRRTCLQRRRAPTVRLGGGAAEPHKALHPADRRTHTNCELFDRLMPRRAGFDQRHHPFRKSKEYGFDIACLQKNESMPEDLLIIKPLGIPSNSPRPKHVLAARPWSGAA